MADGPRPATGINEEALADMFAPLKEGEIAPQIGVIMGSDSDLPVVKPTIDVLRDFEVPFETRFVSAHRTPEWMAYYGHFAVERGVQVIIAAAGGSAHLPGDMASLTRLPVLGVAIEKEPDPLNAALGSMLVMPAEGGPLATIGKNKGAAINAGLVAVRILALSNGELAAKVEARMSKNAGAVLNKDRKLQTIGVDAYLAEMEAAEAAKKRAEEERTRNGQ